ncbi:transferrin receptor protein 2 [Rhinophrynus dorsalis]
METVRDLFREAMPSRNSYSIYRGVEPDQEELHIEENSVVEPSSEGRKKVTPPRISPQCQIIIIGFILTAFLGFLLGYLVTRRPCAACDSMNGEQSVDEDVSYEPSQSDDPINFSWTDLRELFSKYLKDGQQIEDTIRLVSDTPHPAGSERNQILALKVLEKFRSASLDKTWVDSHFAELQYPNRNRPNSLKIVNSINETVDTIEIGDPDLYCPYSATGSVTAGLVYANYGRREDFEALKKLQVNPRGELVIVRSGYISFAQKVYNAEAAGAVGVLIFPDTTQELAVYGHVHLGTGDPDTPGFPSFNHTQFPAFKSSGLPKIPAQPISTGAARKLLNKLAGTASPWMGESLFMLGPKLSDSEQRVKLEVQNARQSVELINVFGSVTGRFEPEHYIVVGAQRDSWGPGAAKSGVGTAILLELARTISMMVHNGFQPRRSLLFVSWDAGEFGSVGATEWLEGYLSMLHLKAAAYMSLDTAVLGDEKFIAKTSPLFKSLIGSILKQVDNPRRSQQSIFTYITSQTQDWEREVILPLPEDSGPFAFTAFAGVPALELSFIENSQQYPYLNTKQDTYASLNSVVGGRLPAVALSLAEVAGLILVRLSHDRILPLDYCAYSDVLRSHVVHLNSYNQEFKNHGLTLQWLSSARGDYTRATNNLKKSISQSDLHNEDVIHLFNVRIMRVEFYFLSQYVSATDFPYRHILIGRGQHTLEALTDHLKRRPEEMDEKLLRKQLALFTWTVKGAANALSGEVWDIQRNF